MRQGLIQNILFIALAFLMSGYLCHVATTDYIEKSDLKRLEPLAARMESIYQETGNFDFLKRVTIEELMPGPPGPPEIGPNNLSPGQAGSPGPPGAHGPHEVPELLRLPPGRPNFPGAMLSFESPHFPHDLERQLRRVRIYDMGGNLLFGDNAKTIDKNLVLESQGKEIARLTLVKLPDTGAELTLHTELNTTLAYGAFLLIIVAISTSYLKPESANPELLLLKAGLAKLSAGQYEKINGTGPLLDSFNTLVEVLAKLDSGHRQWLADTSHELRTPIAVLRAQVEAFQDDVQEVNPRTLSVLHNEIMALSKLVDDLHWLAKYDVGQIKQVAVPTDIISLLNDVLAAAQERFEAKEITIENELGDEKIIINTDSTRLRQVFTNVLENSMRYTDEGGKLKVEAFRETNEIILRFDDSAPSVADDFLPRLFDRFFRVEASRNRTFGGSGLGLAICKNNMTMLGGEIVAGHSPLGGLRIELRLPLGSN